MLSVLIATYNWNAFPLVKELHFQLKKEQIPFEIICFDDASKSDLNTKNEQINLLEHCVFKILPKNIGRSAIRNLLAKNAKYDWLLFLDADVMPKSEFFIKNYIENIQQNIYKVFLGGIAYRENENKNLIRWKLGKMGEEQTTEIRNKNPYNYFFSANFLINKTVFNSIFFNEKIRNYGCEDMLFAKKLKSKKVKIKHIDSIVFHLGIDGNKRFIKKTKSSLNNLLTLIEQKKINYSDAKISNVFYTSMKFKIPQLLFFFINFLEKRAIKTSSLLYFNLFRLAYLFKLSKNNG